MALSVSCSCAQCPQRASVKSVLATEEAVAFDLPLTREAMSDYLGLTLETVSRQISALKKEGVIKLEGNRHVIVPDMVRLLDETGDDGLV